VAGNVAQTIFDAGTLLHKKRAADAAFDEAAAMYRSTVIAAFQNVADAFACTAIRCGDAKGRLCGGARCRQEPRYLPPATPTRRIHYLALMTAENTIRQR